MKYSANSVLVNNSLFNRIKQVAKRIANIRLIIKRRSNEEFSEEL